MRRALIVISMAFGAACSGPIEPTGGETGQGVVMAVEGANGSHIWMQPQDGQLDKLHLRGPNSYNYDEAAPTGSYSQINLYADHLGLWGGTQPNGHAVYLDQRALHPREAGTLDLTGWRSVQAESLRGEGRRYACVEADGTITASLTPCTEEQR